MWVMIQVVFGLTMLRAAMRAHRVGLHTWVAIIGWLIVYWLAAFVNASFDVYLQNPMGGIWYWSVMGLGIAVATIVDRLVVEAAEGPGPAVGAVSAGAAASERSRR
jgi:hypothetical protein